MMMMKNPKGSTLRPSVKAQPSDWKPGLRHRPEWKGFTIDVLVELARAGL
jgi:hypothetical protein